MDRKSFFLQFFAPIAMVSFLYLAYEYIISDEVKIEKVLGIDFYVFFIILAGLILGMGILIPLLANYGKGFLQIISILVVITVAVILFIILQRVTKENTLVLLIITSVVLILIFWLINIINKSVGFDKIKEGFETAKGFFKKEKPVEEQITYFENEIRKLNKLAELNSRLADARNNYSISQKELESCVTETVDINKVLEGITDKKQQCDTLKGLKYQPSTDSGFTLNV